MPKLTTEKVCVELKQNKATEITVTKPEAKVMVQTYVTKISVTKPTTEVFFAKKGEQISVNKPGY